MVVDYLIHGTYAGGYGFYAPMRIWGGKSTDFAGRLNEIMNSCPEIESWEVEESKTRWWLSLFYLHHGNSELHFTFYETDEAS